MDNLFDILVYLIIIISFLAPLFKKKEKPNTTEKPQQSHQRSSDGFSEFETETVVTETSDYDILTELEIIFNQDLGKPKPQIESKQRSEEKIKEVSLEQTSVNYDKFELEKKIGLETQKKFQRKEIKLDSDTEKAAMMFEELLGKQGAKVRTTHLLIKKIRNPRLIKDYIVVSEILNRPLALRK